ncbi:OmpA family protein [Sedimentimonas flavescens]|uniref:OmpA family protein n=1 Tax=Sedimentimonas flavescens TaxID=2851012 RepID=A0ABT3A1R4_9RHOB|nr:OmpA family protein [Sedimentimonas flavescens]MBW0157965.1 OmpA family protein [Sedimentimonas flavescens]MCV2879865.1 OmpA family protein [Sedimentimonas flavescens]
MRLRNTILTTAAFTTAFVLSGLIAGGSATVIEIRSRNAVRLAMEAAGHSWVRVQTDGLQVILLGTAPSEADRFRALTLASTLVDGARVVDNTDVESTQALVAPDFSLEVLRNDDGISLIGLVPAGVDRTALIEELRALVGEGTVTDMLASADYPAPPGWDEAVAFATATLRTVPRSKISVEPGKVFVTAITDSPEEKARIETSLARRRPADLKLSFDISAPRPVITPFTLRFLIDEEGARFDACSADTERARDRILAAARGAGAKGTLGCTLGMGTPSPDWAAAVEMGIGALNEMGSGTITYSDADIALIAADSVTPETFDKAVGELESNLPEVFSLKAELQKKPDASEGVPEFSAILSETGRVTLRGRVLDDRERGLVENFARAQFGFEAVYGATRVDADLPAGWPTRVLAALEALGEVEQGRVVVRPDVVRVTGISGNPQASDAVARILSGHLGEAAAMELDVRYDKRLDPVLALPDGPECVARLNGVLAQHKISFEPGSSTIAADGAETLDALAAAMKDCQGFRMELAGHTDSQGRDEMNLNLSQERAAAVLSALRDRRVLVGNITAKGYGETQPLADNDTEEGREANRRIEFVLLDGEPIEEELPEATAPETAAPEMTEADPAEVLPEGEAPPMEDAAPMEEPAPEGDVVGQEAVEIPVSPASEAKARPKPRPDNLIPKQN